MLSSQTPRVSFFWKVSFLLSVLVASCNGESLLRRRQQSLNATQAPQEQNSSTTTPPPPAENSTEAPTNPADNEDDDDDEEDKPFTIIFVSDLENFYRGHNIRRSQYVINYIRDLKDRAFPFVFDPPYNDQPILPKLVIHGGDIGHMWNCDYWEWFILGGCRNPKDEYRDVWNRLYDAGIPMISAFGNHDWKVRNGTGNPWGSSTDPRYPEGDYINQWSNEFTQLSYEKSAKLTNGKFQYEEIRPTGDIGQSMYRATYGGIQIASFNSAYNWESYDAAQNGMVYSADEQFDRLSQRLDRSMKTIFFSHYPLNGALSGQTPPRASALSLIREFGEGVAHFAGHYHVNRVYSYDAAEPNFKDFVAPYPHTWLGDEPGFLAILMSRKRGVLQVKTINIPGLEDGEKCMPLNYLNIRRWWFGLLPETWGDYFHTQPAAENSATEEASPASSNNNPKSGWANSFSDATQCCSTCKAGKEYWSAEEGWMLCGDEPDKAGEREEAHVEVPDDQTFREEDGEF